MCLNDELADLDKADNATQAANLPDWYRLRSRRYDERTLHCRRKDLLNCIATSLKEYDDLLLREHQIMSIKHPSPKAHEVYFNYIWNCKPLCKEEYQFIYHRDDFALLGDQEDGWLGSYIEAIRWILPKAVIRVGSAKHSTSKL